MTEFFLVEDPNMEMVSVLVYRETPNEVAVPVLSPCCQEKVAQPYMLTALCLGCFQAFNLEDIPVVAAAT